MLFNICVFTFLISKNVVLLFKTGEWMITYSEEQYKHMFICLYITLSCLLFGYYYSKKGKYNKYTIFQRDKKSIFIQRKYFKIIMCIVVPIYIYYLLQQVGFVQTYGYDAYYISFEYSNIFIYSIVNQLLYVSFFGFLTTLPSKKQSMPAILVFVVLSALNWFTGQRNTTILNLMIVLWYYSKRHTMSIEQHWIGKFEKILFIVAVPCIISLSYLYSFLRAGNSIQNISFIQSVFGFFEQLGDSNSVVIYSKTLKSSFPEPHLRYFFSPLIDFFKENRIGAALGLSESLKRYSVDFALKGYSFGSTLSYLLLGQGYLNGGGVGSSYIAEAYLSLGYAGVGAYSLFLGIILKKMENILDKCWIVAIIGMICFKDILISPRETALQWIIKGFNFTTIFTLIPLYILIKTKDKSRI